MIKQIYVNDSVIMEIGVLSIINVCIYIYQRMCMYFIYLNIYCMYVGC